jgi:hypothetical protein
MLSLYPSICVRLLNKKKRLLIPMKLHPAEDTESPNLTSIKRKRRRI